jgi:hypothetical protein
LNRIAQRFHYSGLVSNFGQTSINSNNLWTVLGSASTILLTIASLNATIHTNNLIVFHQHIGHFAIQLSSTITGRVDTSQPPLGFSPD